MLKSASAPVELARQQTLFARGEGNLTDRYILTNDGAERGSTSGLRLAEGSVFDDQRHRCAEKPRSASSLLDVAKKMRPGNIGE